MATDVQELKEAPPVRNNSRKPALGAWWIIVIAFGFAGGLIGYFANRRANLVLAKRILFWSFAPSAALVAAVAIVGAISGPAAQSNYGLGAGPAITAPASSANNSDTQVVPAASPLPDVPSTPFARVALANTLPDMPASIANPTFTQMMEQLFAIRMLAYTHRDVRYLAATYYTLGSDYQAEAAHILAGAPAPVLDRPASGGGDNPIFMQYRVNGDTRVGKLYLVGSRFMEDPIHLGS